MFEPSAAAEDVRVAFFLDDPTPLPALEALDPESDWREFVRGERVWILQSYLRLKAAGWPVQLVDKPTSDGLLIFHAKQRHALSRALQRSGQRIPGCTLVGTRADNRQPLIADFEILQNGRWANETRFSVPHWPQAGLIARDPERGSRIEYLGFKGFQRNLSPDFRQPSWRDALERRGLKWLEDSVEFSGRETGTEALSWNDYSVTDLIVAVRPRDSGLWTSKPATKLLNAWHAGVPALLGAEWSYRELRQSDLDYLEVADPREALPAIDRLIAEPTLYHAMVEHGRSRAVQYTADAITARWAEILFQLIPRRLREPPTDRLKRLPLGLRALLRRGRRFIERRPAR